MDWNQKQMTRHLLAHGTQSTSSSPANLILIKINYPSFFHYIFVMLLILALCHTPIDFHNKPYKTINFIISTAIYLRAFSLAAVC